MKLRDIVALEVMKLLFKPRGITADVGSYEYEEFVEECESTSRELMLWQMQ